MAKKNVKLSSSLEDYLEAIYNLAEKTQVARSSRIAEKLGVSKASVTGALRSLTDKGLINYKPYGLITLTNDGKKLGRMVANRHRIIKSFFEDFLGIDSREAQKAACETEHTLRGPIFSQLSSFMDFVQSTAGKSRDLTVEFKKFCERK